MDSISMKNEYVNYLRPLLHSTLEHTGRNSLNFEYSIFPFLIYNLNSKLN